MKLKKLKFKPLKNLKERYVIDMEKIVCVYEVNSKYLTYGKQYEVVNHVGDYYIIMNNMNQLRRYKSEYFLTIDKFRDLTIDTIIEES